MFHGAVIWAGCILSMSNIPITASVGRVVRLIPGTSLTTGMISAFSRLIQNGSYLFAFYSVAGTGLSYRRIEFESGSWEDEIDVATGTALDDNFNAVVSENGVIGIVYDDNHLYYREYIGAQWSKSGFD